MGLISITNLQDGVTSVSAAPTNNALNTIVNEINGNLSDANIASGAAIAQTKIGLALAGASDNTVATDQSTTSGTAVDLTTAGPSVTATIGTTGMALLLISSSAYNTAGEANNLYYVVSGATTVAATQVLAYRQPDTAARTLSTHVLVTGLTAGSNTFKVQYATSGGGTAHFSARVLTVIPL